MTEMCKGILFSNTLCQFKSVFDFMKFASHLSSYPTILTIMSALIRFTKIYQFIKLNLIYFFFIVHFHKITRL